MKRWVAFTCKQILPTSQISHPSICETIYGKINSIKLEPPVYKSEQYLYFPIYRLHKIKFF